MNSKIKASQYLKVVEWSDEDNCFIGSAPPLIGRCCHGDTEEDVLQQLNVIVAEWIEIYEKDGKALPEPSAGKEFNGKILLRVSPDLHKVVAIRAAQAGQSVNNYLSRMIAGNVVAEGDVDLSALNENAPRPRAPKKASSVQALKATVASLRPGVASTSGKRTKVKAAKE